MVKSEIQEKNKYDILNKVVLKHHNKLKKFQKDEKLDREKKAYMVQKNMENDTMLKLKLKAVADERNEKLGQLNDKFEKMDNNKK